MEERERRPTRIDAQNGKSNKNGFRRPKKTAKKGSCQLRVVWPVYVLLAFGYVLFQMRQSLKASGYDSSPSFSFFPDLSSSKTHHNGNARQTKQEEEEEKQQHVGRILDSFLKLLEEEDDDDDDSIGEEEEEKTGKKFLKEGDKQIKTRLAARGYHKVSERAKDWERTKHERRNFRPNFDTIRREDRIPRNFNMTTGWTPPRMNADFSKDYPILESQVLPDMTTEKGGVIFFLHVPKVGGQTIRFGFDQRQRKRRRKHKGWVRGANEIMGSNITINPQEQQFDKLIKDRIRYVTANWLDIFERTALPLVDVFLQRESNNGRVLFVEVHGMDNYHALELEAFLHYWRDKAKQSGVPFFAFTLLREAISAQVSFFNFYYIYPGDARFCKNELVAANPNLRCAPKEDDNGDGGGGVIGRQDKGMAKHAARLKRLKRRAERGLKDPYPMGDEDKNKLLAELLQATDLPPKGAKNFTHEELEQYMVRFSYDNPQCLFLSRGERTFGDHPDKARLRSNLKRMECQKMYLSLRRTMDWIGRTDTLSSETLPMLTKIMFQNPDIGKNLPRVNTSPEERGFVKLSKMKKATVKALEKKSQLDLELYHRAMQDYTLDQWVNDTNF